MGPEQVYQEAVKIFPDASNWIDRGYTRSITLIDRPHISIWRQKDDSYLIAISLFRYAPDDLVTEMVRLKKHYDAICHLRDLIRPLIDQKLSISHDEINGFRLFYNIRNYSVNIYFRGTDVIITSMSFFCRHLDATVDDRQFLTDFKAALISLYSTKAIKQQYLLEEEIETEDMSCHTLVGKIIYSVNKATYCFIRENSMWKK